MEPQGPTITQEFRRLFERPPVPYDLMVYEGILYLFHGQPHRWEGLCQMEPEEPGEYDVKFQVGPQDIMTAPVDVVLRVILRCFARLDQAHTEEMASTIKKLFLEGQWIPPDQDEDMEPVPGAVATEDQKGCQKEFYTPDINGVSSYLRRPDDRPRISFLSIDGWLTSLDPSAFKVISVRPTEVEVNGKVENDGTGTSPA